MTHLVYYRKEDEEFKEAMHKAMSEEEAGIIYPKLCRHFKLRQVRLEWTSGRNHPCCSDWKVCLNRDWNTFGNLCHEVAHLYQFQYPKYKGNGKWHNKKHRRVMKRMINYCQKKNWFTDELNRRTAPKQIKPEPSKEALRQQKIQRLEESTLRCMSKIKRYQNLVRKINRRVAHLKRFI